MSICRCIVLLVATALLAGCGKGDSQTALPEFHPVKGVVLNNGQPVADGGLTLRAEPGRPELMISALVGADGKFELTTMDTQDRTGKKNPGVPEGVYKVTYAPLTTDQLVSPVELTQPFTVEAGKTNEWTIELKEK